MPYRLDESTGLIDYDALEKTAALYRPKVPLLPAARSLALPLQLTCACTTAPAQDNAWMRHFQRTSAPFRRMMWTRTCERQGSEPSTVAALTG